MNIQRARDIKKEKQTEVCKKHSIILIYILVDNEVSACPGPRLIQGYPKALYPYTEADKYAHFYTFLYVYIKMTVSVV
jgi:hypothetical protein